MATIMDNGLPIKSIETRNRPIEHRGPMAIHSALKKFVPAKTDPVFLYHVRKLGLLNYPRWPEEPFEYGKVLCIPWIVDCLKVDDVRDKISPIELMFGNYVNEDANGKFEQRYAWITDPSKLRILKTPVHEKGHQYFWDWKMPEGLEFK